MKRTDQNGKRTGHGQRERTSEVTGTWNVCGLKDKEPKIIEFKKKKRVSVMGISDCRRKERGQNRFTQTMS